MTVKFFVTLAVLLSLLSTNVFSQKSSQAQTLGAIFPIEAIQSITVKNYHGTHTLTKSELSLLQKQLRQAKFGGGLLVKPGHILLRLQLKGNTPTRPGLVYATKGAIHIDGGIDRFGKQFSGSFRLPSPVNFDNYK